MGFVKILDSRKGTSQLWVLGRCGRRLPTSDFTPTWNTW